MTDADRRAKRWGGFALGLVLIAIGASLAFAAGAVMTGVVFVVGGVAITIGHAIWIARTRRKPE
ncbi:hypothetical protein [Microbacterium sp. BH-3-3-3]|uniref:hypothetical protein n=1 Tax=Microbacterium sp. BH-3-3-3 TaxID=1906742 RepID=UPI0011A27FBD|nr:hypothetical protein [Microbacterium sp. BH-3-3-3]